jgi:hypothetical protein
MSAARSTRWLRALLIVPVMAFGLAAASRLEVRCALTGLVVRACCLEVEPTLTQAPRQASIGERDCCDRTLVATDKTPAADPESALAMAPIPVARLTQTFAVEFLSALRVPPGPRPAWSTPPPYVLTHAFLI